MPVMKPPVVLISSSSDDDDADDDDGIFEEEEEESEISSQDDSNYSESDDQDYDEEEENDVESDEECRDNQGSNDLQELTLTECKTYLRKHGLRLSGTKEECLQRIKEHERLKDGNGESLYPRSSFSINCTGDACKGDVVLFKQKIYNKFDKVVNGRNIVGKRTVAGRIVKESYGASKQQHTFTVEVLWNKGSKRLPPLSTLLVKGRNLYRYGTYRQAWENEAERSKVLQEKHTRGDAARHKRKSNKAEFTSINDKGRKRQKRTHAGLSQTKQPTRTTKQKRGTAHVNKSNTSAPKRKAVQFEKTEMPFRSNPSHSIYTNHHRQPSSSSLPFSYDRIPSFQNVQPLYGHYNIGQSPQPNHVMFQYQNQYQYRPPPRYYHYNI
ncbi:hypothetical protein L1887_36317 [Cichorium endivia]|nr:hypothetical protein L1887_36317 [Cichorium endivia]